MTRDTNKFLELARICAVLAHSAPTSRERETFVTLAETWRAMATTAGYHESFVEGENGMSTPPASEKAHDR